LKPEALGEPERKLRAAAEVKRRARELKFSQLLVAVMGPLALARRSRARGKALSGLVRSLSG